nr:Na/Pi symporter [Quisquiliibacterium transsilvanicum]
MAGGVGLFLLGMTMMTDGLRVAAGPALERILANATRTRWHALGTGVLVTALVQSSTAITVATIGFVNAGLLGLAPALWVVFGSNLGSTMIGWIVSLLGLKLGIEAFALPLIGLGVALRLTGMGLRRGDIGSALAGFGLMFLGISMLQETFTGLAGQASIPRGEGPFAVAAQVAAGALLTILVQSSSATITIAITAAQGGLLDAQSAAAVVIGANVGTTFTAILAAIGATSNARRAAAAHVAFNLVAAAAALALLPWLVDAIAAGPAALGLAPGPAIRLAMFHTAFNLIGVVLMWPLAQPLTRWLQGRFRAREDDEAQPRHLDETVLAVPSLAVDAFEREVDRIGHVATRMARTALSGAQPRALRADQTIVEGLVRAAEGFVERFSRDAMARGDSERLARILRVQRYHEAVAEQSPSIAPLSLPPVHDQRVVGLHKDLLGAAERLFALCDPLAPRASEDAIDAAAQSLETAYQVLKAALLDSGATGSARLTEMDDALRRYSALRRAAQQAAKAARHRAALARLSGPSWPAAGPSGAPDDPGSA